MRRCNSFDKTGKTSKPDNAPTARPRDYKPRRTPAQTAADESGVIERRRKFTGLSLARTFVLGFLQKPNASDEELAQIAVPCGAAVTPQAVEQRPTPKLVTFLEKLCRGATTLVVGSDRTLAPLLERSTRVTILDSTTLTLPDDRQGQFRGCGGS